MSMQRVEESQGDGPGDQAGDRTKSVVAAVPWTRAQAIGYLIVLALIATSLVQPASASAQGFPVDLNVEVSCLAGNGRLDISLTPTTTGPIAIHVGTLAPRVRDSVDGQPMTEVVTGRRDGQITVDVRLGGVIIDEERVVVECDPNRAQVEVEVSCLANNGRIDVWLSNSPDATQSASYEVSVDADNYPALAPRTRLVSPGGTVRATITGRPDDTYDVSVARDGAAVFSEDVVVSCDPSADAVTATLSCLGENGRVDFDLFNDGAHDGGAAVFTVSVPPLSDRERVLSPGDRTRVSYTGRPDLPIDAEVRRDGIVVWQQTLTPDCDPVDPVEPPVSDGGFALPSSVAVRAPSDPFLVVGLSEGVGGELPVEDPISVVAGTPLDQATTDALLDQLPPITIDQDDVVEFRPPEVSLPRPTTGTTIDEAFPPGADPDPVDVPVVPVEIVRFQPEGETPIAQYVSVTFNQPMVPLGAVGEIEAGDAPLTINPAVPGRWEWVGTRTLRFEYLGEREPADGASRLPGATSWTATVPAGTRSATGSVLTDAASWSFETSPVQVETISPWADSTIRLDQVFVARFDQWIDPQAVVDTISLRAKGFTTPVRLATDAEIAADRLASSTVNSSTAGRYVAFRAVTDFPVDAPVRIEFVNVPSAEGPLLQTDSEVFTFRTFGAFEIAEVRCGYPECGPFTTAQVRFTNQIDQATLDVSAIEVTPEIPELSIVSYGTSLFVRGETSAQTTYTVTVPADVADIYGQPITGKRIASFRVGDARPLLTAFGGRNGLVTLDPFAAEPTIDFTVMNLSEVAVSAYSVTPNDWDEWNEWNAAGRSGTPPGVVAFDVMISTGAEANVLTELSTDLGGALDDHAALVVQVSARDGADTWSYTSWVQVTEIGIDVVSDGDELRAWVTDLKTGTPIPGATVRTITTGQESTTDAQGLATLALVSNVSAVAAQVGDDRALLAAGGWPGARWSPGRPSDQLRWHTFDDRSLYRPGETVSVKGWLRTFTGSADAQIELSGVTTVRWSARDPLGNEIATGSARASVLGGFDLEFVVPTNANLGTARVSMTATDPSGIEGSVTHRFQIAEFRRPEFEVAASVTTPEPHFAGGVATVDAAASYFAGGALPNAQAEWSVTSATGSYSPPNWSEFAFGSASYRRWSGFDAAQALTQTFVGTTGSDGVHRLDLDLATNPEVGPSPVVLTATVGVTDVNRQRSSDSTMLLVHPADRYVGLRTDKSFVRRSEPLTIDAIVTDLDGQAAAGLPVAVEFARVVGRWTGISWVTEEVDAQTCSLTSGAAPVSCTLTPETGGQWVVRAHITDAAGRTNLAELTRWVGGGRLVSSDRVELESVELIADRDDYQPGDTASVLVVSPFETGHGLLTIARNGILDQKTFEIVGGSAEVTVAIGEGLLPNVALQVELVGSAPRTDRQGQALGGIARPAYAAGLVELSVPARSKQLSLDVTPASSELVPGAETAVTVRVADANAVPVAGAEVALVVVDEAVLSLSGYTIADPLNSFWRRVGAQISSTYGRRSIQLASLDDLLDDADFVSLPSPPVAEASNAERGNETASADLRSNFDPLAVFAPAVTTAPDGTATVLFTLPDNLTRYRVIAVAAAGANQFGTGESALTARLPLMVRPSAPRFMNFGDQAELPVVVQNQTGAALEVDVAIRSSNLDLAGPTGTRVTVPANDRVEVRFPAAAAAAGTARFQVIAVSGADSDAAEIDLPVLTPATAEAFATYGVIDGGDAGSAVVVQPIDAPDAVYPEFGGLAVGTSSTALHSLSDAVLYVSDYPYRDANALASRVLAIVALDEVLPAFGSPDLPAPAELRAGVLADIEALLALQNGDGGFASWRQGRPSQPWTSVLATHALVVADAGGYPVAEGRLQSALGYVADIEAHLGDNYSPRARDSVSAYALYVRHLAGDTDTAKANALFREDLAVEALAWIWPIVDNAVASDVGRVLNNRVTETPSNATFATSYDDGDYLILRSDRRTDGIVLDSLIRMDPGNDLIPKVVAGLQAVRTRGRWRNIQENTFILLALESYFKTFEGTDPDLVARMWLGELYAAEHTHVGRSTDRVETLVPMANVLAAGDSEIVVENDGAGRLYYRLGLRYAPTDLDLDPVDRGFVVQRTYESIGEPDDVQQDADGSWRITAGADVRVTVTMVADSVRTHVALIDPLPAGLEPQNPEAVVAPILQPFDGGGGFGGGVVAALRIDACWWCYGWFDHQNLRDDRAEAFATWLPGGTYDYTYVARATTPGRFVAPPTRAEMLYEPEVFGRSGTDIVIIEG